MSQKQVVIQQCNYIDDLVEQESNVADEVALLEGVAVEDADLGCDVLDLGDDLTAQVDRGLSIDVGYT